MPIMACLDSGVGEEGGGEMVVVEFVLLVEPGGERSCWLNTASRPPVQFDLGDITVAAPVSLVVFIVSTFDFLIEKEEGGGNTYFPPILEEIKDEILYFSDSGLNVSVHVIFTISKSATPLGSQSQGPGTPSLALCPPMVIIIRFPTTWQVCASRSSLPGNMLIHSKLGRERM